MVMKDRKKFLIASGIGIAAGAALFTFLKKKRENTRRFDEYEDEMYLDFSLNSAFSYEDAEKKASEFAKNQFGSNVAVVSASDKKAVTVDIDGISRHCFLFGAVSDNLSVNSETLLLYVDAVTGEVFEGKK